ncbi:MAG: hypothetical protein ACOZCL_13330 [Bacillota bacterium]
MDLIERYVYAVVKSLPEKQREDIKVELKALIDEMIDVDKESESYDEKVTKVLLELGDPEILADNYRGSMRYLIGPKYYDKYLLVLQIVLGAVFAGVSIAFLVGGFFSADKSVAGIISSYISNIFYALLQAFAWTTLGFVIAERNTIYDKKDLHNKSTWDLSQLPYIPSEKATIPFHEPIVSIVFTTVFFALLLYVPEAFAVYSKSIPIPVFNIEVIQSLRVLLACILIVSIFRDVLKLYFRRWNLKLSAMIAALDIISLALIVSIFANNHFWNQSFASQVSKYMNLTSDFIAAWAHIKNWIVAVIILIGIIDIAVTLYKGFKYNKVK